MGRSVPHILLFLSIFCTNLNFLLEAYKMPRYTRAYSDGSLPPPTAESDRGSTTTKDTLYRGKNYQATVEDCTDAEDNGCTPRSSRSGSPPPRPGSEEPNSDRRRQEQRQRVFAASAPTSPTANPALVREHTAPSAVPPVKEVRFSDRVPVVLQRRSSARDERYTGINTPSKANMRLPRETSPSPLDAKWGKLFRSRGEPTRRLANVLRGLARYLVSSYASLHGHNARPALTTSLSRLKFTSRHTLSC